jgi:hypothetical protein
VIGIKGVVMFTQMSNCVSFAAGLGVGLCALRTALPTAVQITSRRNR